MGVVLLGNHQCPKIQREGLGEGEKTPAQPWGLSSVILLAFHKKVMGKSGYRPHHAPAANTNNCRNSNLIQTAVETPL